MLDFIDFKGRVAAGIRACRILSILPAELVDHIRREALFFSEYWPGSKVGRDHLGGN
ncbi:DUF2935 domain-containing protein [Thermosediminibacter oceani]|uniref:DUF2935 domain-containing protein n=1 Tax=Thermosediminibacter oceani TaxID=291990 RepID=UPI0016518DF8